MSGRETESTAAREWDGTVISLRACGFPSGLSPRSAVVAVRMLGVVGACRRRMRTERPQILLAMGSYASVGPVLAARRWRVPVVLHEANVVPGRANAWLSRFASAVAVTFDGAASRLPRVRVVKTGLPLRSDLDTRFPDGALQPGMFNVLVMGGSQGAHYLNTTVPQAIADLAREGVVLQVIHLAGQADQRSVREFYAARGVPARVFAFLGEMGKAYGAADFAISRAGAAACMELAACRVPALLIPFPYARAGHQMANARAVESAGGAFVLDQATASTAKITAQLRSAAGNRDVLDGMRKALDALAVPRAAEKLADLVLGEAGAEV